MADETGRQGKGQVGMNRINASFLAHQVIGVIALLLFQATPVALAQAARTPISASTESGVRIEPVPSKLYIPPDAQNGHFAAVPAFRGSGVGQVDYHISAIQPDIPSTNTVGPRKTGVVYTFPNPINASILYWEPASGGFAARVRIIADQAQSLRIHLSFVDQSPLVEIRVQGNQDATPLGPILGAAVQDREIWLPITLGGEAVLELFFPTEEAMQSGEFRVDQVNYIFGANGQFGQFASTGAAQYLEYDATCYTDHSDYAAIQHGVAATAKIDFLMNGASYLCSGTLLNDRGSTGTPWFATANHCIPTQTVANTITFRWHYEATTCGGPFTDSRYTQTFGGAQLLWSNVTYDAAFLKLNSPPGAYTYFSGWNPNSLVVGEHVYGIHHPDGDHTMVSEGTVTALDASGTSINTGLSLTLNRVRYTHGGIEGGSSGSGVFSTPGGSLYWQGALFGGLPSNYQDANYGPFDNFYNNVKQYLDHTTQPGGVMTLFGTRGTVTPTTPMYGSFALANTSVIYIAVLGPTLGILGYTNNPLNLPNVRVYDASGHDVLRSVNGGVIVAGCASSSTVATYYATIRGGALNVNDTCVSATLAAGVYTFTINPNTSSSSGELLFEVTVNPTPPPGGVMTLFGTRGTVTPTTPMYGSFALANTSVIYIAVLGPTLGILGYTTNPLNLPNVRVYDASGHDALRSVNGGVIVSGCASSSTVANYYATIRGGALNVNDTCVSATLAAGVYTFTINPNTSSSSGEMLFEVTVNP